ncbi:MAG: hypothetical protein VKM98_08010 [Cyanobacteriota bacterium]|nr:hypothetical protein [Cyanobacteriota bacterium]
MAANRVTPLSKLGSQSPLFRRQRERLQILEALMHQIEGFVNELCCLF